MLITNTVTKKILENIVHETFSKFGNLASSSLLDSLKLLGFYYATSAGISINIEDLKTPDVKKKFIQTANDEINFISKQWQEGFVSDTERFQTIIDSWNIATESLKNRIVDYYRLFDPANNLYIMAFSGARGNMSQVRQLVGLRGLMSDQEGKIIDLPIQANFREGLSSIDYIISSYGARKGIVDTALKTADSGYLTRRLIYIAQDLIIREVNCQTTEGVIILLHKKTNVKNLLGRTLISVKSARAPFQEIYAGNNILDSETFEKLKEAVPLSLNIRSSLTCKSIGSICQHCYGWDLAHGKLISLGEAVGIIAAQSIGEPGTQLTMRTFHTGGIFTGETLQQVVAPFSGKLLLPKVLKTIAYRTNHGTMVLKLQQEAVVSLVNWQGIQKDIFLEIGSYLYVKNSSFIKKGQLISEYSTQSTIPGTRRLKPIYTSLAGEIRFENLLIRKMLRDQRTVKVNQDDGILWIASGKIFPLRQEAKFLFPKILDKKVPFASLKIMTPVGGFVNYQDNQLFIVNQRSLALDFSNVSKTIVNCSVNLSFIVKNWQHVDPYTILGYLELFPKYEGMIYSIRKKESTYINTYFIITESDVWKIHSDQVNNFSFFTQKKAVVRAGTTLNQNTTFTRSGFFLKKDGFKMIFQNALPVFLSRGTILNYKQGDFVLEKKIFATLVNYTQQTEDIVQGLPKIEELIEARRPKVKSYLSKKPGIMLNNGFFRSNIELKKQSDVISCRLDDNYAQSSNLNSHINISHRLPMKSTSLSFEDNLQLYKEREFPTVIVNKAYKKYERKLKTKNKKSLDQLLRVDEPRKLRDTALSSFFRHNYRYRIDTFKKEWLIQKQTEQYKIFETLYPITSYPLPNTSKVLFEPGNFIDLGEPITEGIIDVHELLHILFEYHSQLDGIQRGTLRSLQKFQLLLVNSIQSIYQSQGVSISSKHIEIIVRQMTSKVVIKESGDTPFLTGEVIRFSLINEIYSVLLNTEDGKPPKYEPMLMSATNASLSKDGFLSAAGFQETKRILAKAAIEGSTDWLRGLKECIIIGRLIPAGSTFLNYKSYLDNIYFFKDKPVVS
jgi:hypothetical protein